MNDVVYAEQDRHATDSDVATLFHAKQKRGLH